MFVFRKKNKASKKIDQLLDLIEKDPDNVKNRLRLADVYVRAGDKKSAIREYRAAAKHLCEEGFNLKTISIYKKIFALDGMSLSDYKSLASLYTEEGLLAEAARTYERILQIRPEDQDAQEALREISTSGETRNESETQATDISGPVPIESLLAPSQEEETRPDPSFDLLGQTLEGIDIVGPSDEEPGREGIFQEGGEEPAIDTGNVQTDNAPEATLTFHEERPNPGDVLHGKLLRDLDVSDLSDDRESSGEGLSSDRGNDQEIDVGNIQIDDVFETMQSFDEEKPHSEAPPHGQVLRDLTAEDLSNTSGSFEDNEPSLPRVPPLDASQPSPFDGSGKGPDPSGQDPNLNYHLGVAYREMELIDKAIEEFTKALEQGNNPLDCLIMLARCYFEKGLFDEATEFIHRALVLENLTQDQIDLLHRQLEEVEAVGKVA